MRLSLVILTVILLSACSAIPQSSREVSIVVNSKASTLTLSVKYSSYFSALGDSSSSACVFEMPDGSVMYFVGDIDNKEVLKEMTRKANYLW